MQFFLSTFLAFIKAIKNNTKKIVAEDNNDVLTNQILAVPDSSLSESSTYLFHGNLNTAASEIKQSINNQVEVELNSNMRTLNSTMMQYFEWYLKSDSKHWDKVKEEVPNLSKLGITALWLPPAYKGAQGKKDVGYGVYDLYDLGEFDQKNCVETKYGTKDAYLSAIKEAQKHGIEIYADIVLSHKGGADDVEKVKAIRVDKLDRNKQIGQPLTIDAWTHFIFEGRNGKYSDFTWNYNYFNAVDLDNATGENSIFRFCKNGNGWSKDVDTENGNFEFLMYADIDMTNNDVVEELKNWGKWYIDTTHIDGFRFDAVKHIKFSFCKDWITYLRNTYNKNFFAVGEYWSGDVRKLENYLHCTDGVMNLFDVPLHFNFVTASYHKDYNLSNLLNNTLTKSYPEKSVLFVDNHDTEPNQALESWVQPWFKPLAYTFILTRLEGIPCVFYGDYYGIPEFDIPSLKQQLDIILNVRKKYAYGLQHDYFDDASTIGWTREGDVHRRTSGLAALISNAESGSKWMYVGKKHSNQIFYDCTGNVHDKVIINKEGFGNFSVSKNNYSIWIPRPSRRQNENIITISFSINLSTKSETSQNNNYYISGNITELGEWDSTRAIKLSCKNNLLQGKIKVPTNTIIEFKLFNKQDNYLNWEVGCNRSTFSGTEDFEYTGRWRNY